MENLTPDTIDEYLANMARTDLQSVAKQYGIKANKKVCFSIIFRYLCIISTDIVSHIFIRIKFLIIYNLFFLDRCNN